MGFRYETTICVYTHDTSVIDIVEQVAAKNQMDVCVADDEIDLVAVPYWLAVVDAGLLQDDLLSYIEELKNSEEEGEQLITEKFISHTKVYSLPEWFANMFIVVEDFTKKTFMEVYKQLANVPAKDMENYSFKDHLHNYAVWTAARAVQRKFTTTALIKKAIEKSTLRWFWENNSVKSADEFDELHKSWAHQLMKYFDEQGVKGCNYGRAAKIIAIYLKTAVVLPNRAEGFASSVIHPPIDAILLKNIYTAKKIRTLRNLRWTTLKEQQYWELVTLLRSEFTEFNWKLEAFWTPEQE